MKLIGRYKNGNYTVSIFDDGTKIRQNNLDTLEPDTIESMDLLLQVLLQKKNYVI